jgi:uncharacterized membrane protein YcaP (DUF421 family)
MATAFIRTFIIYILLTVTLRTMGKRQLGELEISELVSTLLLSELASAAIGDPSIPLAFAVLSILLIVALEFLVSDLKNRSPLLKRVFDGVPSVLVSKGKINQTELRRMRVSVEELLSAFRLQGVADPSDVYYAILEQNGQLSVLLREAKTPPTAETLGVKVTERGLTHALIVDGQINKTALTLCQKSEKWLKDACSHRGEKIENVFLFALDDAGEITLVPKEKEKKA